MRSVVNILVVLLLIGTAAGIAVVLINKVRQSAALMQCRNTLKLIALGAHNYHDAFKHFPPGTVANAELPPEKRLSWLIEIRNYMEGGVTLLFDKGKAWDDPVNCPVRAKFRSMDPIKANREYIVGDYWLFLCPANPAKGEPNLPGVTHYVGIAGLGENAADLPLLDANAGIFGYDCIVALEDLLHGRATTMMAAETLQAGLWTAGGPNTVRGLVAEKQPYFGTGGQFASMHPAVTNVAFADGSVRPLTASVSPKVVEALATVAGDKNIARFEE